VRARVAVDCVLAASSATTVTVAPARWVGLPPSATGALRLDPPRPNPFIPSRGPLSVQVTNPEAQPLRLAVYDLSGRRVATILDGPAPAGTFALAWDGRSAETPIDAGLYFLRLTAAGREVMRKFSLMP
jgi:hypothetical protein